MGRLTCALVAVLALAACGANADPPPRPPGADIPRLPDSTIVAGQVPPNSTLEVLLSEQGLLPAVVQEVIEATRTVFDPRRLRSAQPYTLEQALDGALRLFEYEIDADSFLRVVPGVDEAVGLVAEVVPIPKALEYGEVSGTIDVNAPSLFQAMTATGERPELALAMAQVFAGEIDFNTGMRIGDSFVVAFERFVREGRPDTYGALTAAEFRNDGRVVRAIRFTPEDGEPGYFDENGRSLRRFFLASPLKFDPRITSGFSTRRMHPVLNTPRAHNGVDYRAPTGAEVVAISAGRVVGATYDNANGRMVRLRHAQGFESYYLHLSAFGPGIRAGVQVEQGRLIGRVGSTGLATGPHLHYGLKKNGSWVNPLTAHRNMPPGDPVPAADLEAFGLVRDEALAFFARQQPDGAAPPGSVAAQ
jgi:murein DD-endopeptidase MepM/ murein hydrolase activator NlpD